MAAGMTWSRETRKQVRRMAKAGLEPAEIAARMMKPYQAIRDFLASEERSAPEAECGDAGYEPAPTARAGQDTSPASLPVQHSGNSRQPARVGDPVARGSDTSSKPAPAAKPQPALRRVSNAVEAPLKPAREASFPALPARRPSAIARTSPKRSAEEQAAIDAFLAKGKVTKLPPGHAAGISAIEMEHHAAPLAIEQMKGGAARLKRQREAGRNGRRIRDSRRGSGK